MWFEQRNITGDNLKAPSQVNIESCCDLKSGQRVKCMWIAQL